MIPPARVAPGPARPDSAGGDGRDDGVRRRREVGGGQLEVEAALPAGDVHDGGVQGGGVEQHRVAVALAQGTSGVTSVTSELKIVGS